MRIRSEHDPKLPILSKKIHSSTRWNDSAMKGHIRATRLGGMAQQREGANLPLLRRVPASVQAQLQLQA